MKKILFLINSLEGGGAERVLNILAHKFLDEKNIEIIIYTLEKKTFAYDFNSKIKIKSFHTGVFNRGAGKILNLPLQILELLKVIIQERPFAVVSFLNRANIINAFTFLRKKHRIILSERTITTATYSSNSLKDKIMMKLIKKSYVNSDKIIAISNGVKQSLVSLGIDESKIEVIYNPIKIEESINEYKLSPKENFSIVTVGRLVSIKDHENLIKAFKVVNENTQNITLNIVGEGPLEYSLKEQAKLMGIEDKVRFHGWVENPSIILSQSDLFVLSSKNEAFGNVILEAMSVSLPILSTKSEGPLEILEHGKYGVLINKEDPKGMAKEIIDFYKSHKKLIDYSVLSSERVKHFDLNRISNQYLKIILNHQDK